MFDNASSPTIVRNDGDCQVLDLERPRPASREAHDMSYDNVMTSPRGRDSHHDMSWALAEIESRIENIERELAAVVFDHLTRNPGSRAGEIAAGLEAGRGAVAAHLYRGKGQLFSNRAGRWFPIPAADHDRPGVS
jgi:hypothetical protein